MANFIIYENEGQGRFTCYAKSRNSLLVKSRVCLTEKVIQNVPLLNNLAQEKRTSTFLSLLGPFSHPKNKLK